jgi:6-phosphogluconolactonase (cycloisomerase 2 family)
MKTIKKISFTTLLLCFVIINSAKAQISYLGQVFQYQDGLYGMLGGLSVTSSSDRKNIFYTSQYGLSVFANDTLNHNLSFEKSLLADDNGQTGLYDANCVKTSHDGKNVYVLSGSRDLISIFKRDITNGSLSLIRTMTSADVNSYSMREPNDMAISDDDRFVYITTRISDRILVFERNTETGDLTIKEIQYPKFNGRPSSVRLSNDNLFVYVTLSGSNQIAVYSRNTTTGLLTLVQLVKDGENGVQGLFSPKILEVSKDDKNIYVMNSSSIIMFNRNSTTGELSYVTKYVDGQNGIDGLAGNYCIGISPDDRNIYTASMADTSLVIFDRNTTDGQLAFKRQMNIFHRQIAGGYSNSSILCENSDVYLTEYWTSTLHTFFRDTLTGDLTYNQKYQNGDGATINGLYRPTGATESYDNKNVYTINSSEGIVVFAKDDTSGKLIYKRFLKSSDPNNNWSKRVYSLACSKDNKYLYAISNAKQICIFKRDLQNDSLILVDSVPNKPEYNLWDFVSIKISPDGRFFNVIPSFGTKIGVFKFNETNGSLSFVATYNFEDKFGGGISVMRNSPNGKYIFSTSSSSTYLAMFKRNISTSEINFVAKYQYFPNQTNQGVVDFTVSNDGKNVYTVSMYQKAINIYSVDYANDTLLPIGSLHFDDISNSQFYYSNVLELSTDDRYMYVSSLDYNNLKILSRNPTTGMLTYMKTLTEQDGFEGFDGVNGMVISNNTRNLYLTSNTENSVSSYKLLLDIGLDISACEGDTVTVNAGTNYASYLWSTGESTPSIKVNESGIYSVEATDFFGNTEYDTLVATFHPMPELELGENLSICLNDTTVLDAGSGDFSYEWNTGDTLSQIIATNAGTYKVRKISEFGCVSTDSISVSSFPLPLLHLGNDTIVHKKQIFTISVPGFESYLWYNGNTNPTIDIDSASFVTNPMLVWLKVTDVNHCENTDTVKMTYLDSGLGVEARDLPDLQISPNPFGNYLEIKSGTNIEFVELLDMNGITVLKLNVNFNQVFVSTETIAEGIYLLHLKANGKDYFQKVIRKK